MATLQATVTGFFMGQTVQHVLHFFAGDYTSADLALLAADLRDNFCTYLQGGLTAEFTYTNISVRALGTTDPTYNLTVAIVGSAGSDPDMLPTTCCVFRLQTSFGGKHGRGRLYVPCVGPFCLQYGVITPTCIATYQTRADNILGRYGVGGSSDYGLVVHERASGDNHFVTSITPRSIPGVQRRRSIGVGI